MSRRLNIALVQSELIKKDEDKAKETLSKGLESIDYELIKKEVEKRFKDASDSEDYKKIIRIFNEKGLSKSIGHFMSITDKDYCDIVIGMLRNGTINEDVWQQYLPGKDEIPR